MPNTLEITPAWLKTEQAGTVTPQSYTSTVSTNFDFSSNAFSASQCSLFFSVLPKIVHFSFGDEPSYLSDSATVQCSLSAGDMPVRFSWLLNGETIENVDGIRRGSFGKKISVLAIDSVEEHHAGNYTCTANNSAGSSSYTTELIVKGTRGR